MEMILPQNTMICLQTIAPQSTNLRKTKLNQIIPLNAVITSMMINFSIWLQTSMAGRRHHAVSQTGLTMTCGGISVDSTGWRWIPRTEVDSSSITRSDPHPGNKFVLNSDVSRC